MPYDEIELEKKRKMLENYWAFAYAAYLKEYNEQIKGKYMEAFRTLADTFAPQPKKEDVDRDRIAKAAIIVKAAKEVHEELKENKKEQLKVREELQQSRKEDSVDDYAAKIRNGIIEYCSRFSNEIDRKSIAKDAPCLLEYLDAMHENPELSAKVGLDDKQYSAASKVVTMGMIIKEGLECLEAEYADAASPRHEIDEKQHAINLTKITMMDVVNEKRLKEGDLIKELQNCGLMKKYVSTDRFELAAKMADMSKRKDITKAIAADAGAKTMKTGALQKKPN